MRFKNNTNLENDQNEYCGNREGFEPRKLKHYKGEDELDLYSLVF